MFAEETLLQNASIGHLRVRFIPWIAFICILVSGCQGDLYPGTAVLEGTVFELQETREAVPDQAALEFTSLNAPLKDIKFGKISVDQGLSQSSVSSIIQDSSGLMWFGTDDGLNKFDGHGFSIYKHNPEDANSISSNNIQSIK